MAHQVCNHLDGQHGSIVLDNQSREGMESVWANRVKKIAETTGQIDVTWKYCPSDLNQAGVEVEEK